MALIIDYFLILALFFTIAASIFITFKSIKLI